MGSSIVNIIKDNISDKKNMLKKIDLFTQDLKRYRFMNWLTNFVKPKLSALVKRKDVPENLWQNCPKCGNMIHHKDLRENLNVCNSCNHHFRMSVEDRINLLFAKEDTIEIELDKISDDPLNFTDKKKYKDRLKEYRKKTKG